MKAASRWAGLKRCFDDEVGEEEEDDVRGAGDEAEADVGVGLLLRLEPMAGLLLLLFGLGPGVLGPTRAHTFDRAWPTV